jgi:hypothetical protein
MDNYTAHAGDAFLEMCRDANVRLILLPPHSSNQLQMLDLCVFGVTKRLIARLNKLDKKFKRTTWSAYSQDFIKLLRHQQLLRASETPEFPLFWTLNGPVPD